MIVYANDMLMLCVQKRDRKMREKLARAHDETLDDQEVELLDETVQPNGHYMVGRGQCSTVRLYRGMSDAGPHRLRARYS